MAKSLAFVSFLFLLFLSTSIAAQDPPSGALTPSLSKLKASDEFVSKEGRFRILLPKNPTSFSPGEPGKGGGTYEWEVKEGSFVLHFFEKPDAMSFTPAQRQQMLADGLASGMKNAGGTRISEEPSDLGSIAGRRIRIRIPGDRILLSRAYSDGTRLYMLIAAPNSSLPGAEQLVTNSLDSFKIIAAAESRTQIQ